MSERRISTEDPWNTTSRLPLPLPTQAQGQYSATDYSTEPVLSGSSGFNAGFNDDEAALKQRHVVIREGDLAGRFLSHKTYDIQIENGLIVSRRYSEFTFLLNVLTAHYGFRMLPALPPKKLTVNARYLSIDDGLFLEREAFLASRPYCRPNRR